MDYHRIYREFIADRKLRASSLTGYSESHHIVPRAHGGSDEKDNLIRLSPEDHFFAHLCWAKAVDTMEAWSAVMVMHERAGRSDILKRRSRLRYGWARRRFGEWCQVGRLGSANPNFKADIIEMKNLDGRTEALMRSAWLEKHGIPHAALCGVLSGKTRSYHGWMLPDTDPAETGRAYAGRKKRIATKFDWVHQSGRTMRASPYDFAEAEELRISDATAVARGDNMVCAGWSIAGRKTGWPCGRQHFRDERSHRIVRADGASFTGTQREIINQSKLDQRAISALVTGRIRSHLGWMLEQVAAEGYLREPRKRRAA